MSRFSTRFRRQFLLGVISLAGLAGLARSAEAARSVELRNMAVRVVIEPQARDDVDLKVTYGDQAALPKITVRTSGDRLIADGQLNLRGDQGLESDRRGVKLGGGARIDIKDLPVVHIRMPMDVRMTASRGVYMAEIAKASTLKLDLDGQGDWEIAEVGSETHLVLAGQDHVTAGSLQAVSLKMRGSGAVSLASVSELKLDSNGSGEVDIAQLLGPGHVNMDGSGTVFIHDGLAPKLDVTVSGSGAVRYEGLTSLADLVVLGSGTVSVRKVTGPLKKRIEGSGTINIGH